jgi:hypothetical protein
VIRPETAASAIAITLDSTFIRSCEDGERHLEVRVGNVETRSGRRQVFGAVAKAGTDSEGLIRRNLDAVGGTGGTLLTAFTDVVLDSGAFSPAPAISDDLRGTAGRNGGSGGNGGWRESVVGWLEFMSEFGTERTVVDRAPNLKQKVRAATTGWRGAISPSCGWRSRARHRRP